MVDQWGIDSSYVDALGEQHEVADTTVAQLRDLIGEPRSLFMPLVVTSDDPPDLGRGLLTFEDGTSIDVDGRMPPLPLGYHVFCDDHGHARRVIRAPSKCYLPAWRAWGWSTQLYATRSSHSWGMGDLGDLARLTKWSRQVGAGFVLINPIAAVAPVSPQQPSPYYPASRRFRNPIYLRIEDVPAGPAASAVVERAAAAGAALNDDRTIDRDTVWRLKLRALEAIWRDSDEHPDFDEWYRQQPAALDEFAKWSVLVEQYGPSFRDWTTNCRHPNDPGVAAVAARHHDRIRFHCWMQWLVEGQLALASNHTPIIHDLPIGVDPTVFDAWTWQDSLALDASIGAPPDELNRQGQDWGIPPFVPWRLRAANYDPFIATIRATIASGGGLRIDHVMGLFRLWWIPKGNGASEGAYVHYPAHDLLAIVALESQRARAIIVGEDLGTVDESMRSILSDHDVLSYRLLWFDENDPARWPSKSMAAVTTHDLPTVAGLWDGTDLEAQRRLGLDPAEESIRAIRDRLVSATDLAPDAPPVHAVARAYELISHAPSVLVAATLDDAVAEPERPNMPGADGRRPNWSLALPATLEEVETHPLATRIAAELDNTIHR